MAQLTLETMGQLVDQKLDEKLGPVMHKVEKIEQHQVQQDQRMDKMEQQIANLKEGGSSADGFVPKSIEIKNFCEFADRKANGLRLATRKHS